MCLSKIDSMYVTHAPKRICQGDILRDFVGIDWGIEDTSDKYKISALTLPYIIVMTQDCDLELDFNNRSEPDSKTHDKYLQTILVCPAYNATEFKEGEHLKSKELVMNKWGTDLYNQIKNQNHARFYFLEQNQAMQVPQLIVDFKHYYTIPRDVLYKMYAKCYLATFNKLFRESLSQRFSNYLSRIGLPELASTSVASPPQGFDKSECDKEQ